MMITAQRIRRLRGVASRDCATFFESRLELCQSFQLVSARGPSSRQKLIVRRWAFHSIWLNDLNLERHNLSVEAPCFHGGYGALWLRNAKAS